MVSTWLRQNPLKAVLSLRTAPLNPSQNTLDSKDTRSDGRSGPILSKFCLCRYYAIFSGRQVRHEFLFGTDLLQGLCAEIGSLSRLNKAILFLYHRPSEPRYLQSTLPSAFPVLPYPLKELTNHGRTFQSVAFTCQSKLILEGPRAID